MGGAAAAILLLLGGGSVKPLTSGIFKAIVPTRAMKVTIRMVVPKSIK